MNFHFYTLQRTFSCLLLFLLAATLLLPGSSIAAELELDHSEKKRIVFLGDSLTAGYGLSDTASFPSLLEKRVESEGYDYEILNAGVSGDTSAGGLRRLAWLMKKPVSVLVVALGGNDGLRGLSTTSLKENLKQIIQRARVKVPDVKIILAGMLAPPSMGERYTTSFKTVFPEVAAEEEVGFMPFLLEGVAADRSLNLPDGIHPNAEGQKLIAENLWKYLEPLLSK